MASKKLTQTPEKENLTINSFYDIKVLPTEVISVLETRCHEKEHLDKDESLIDRITLDELSLSAIDITHDQIYQLHKLIQAKCSAFAKITEKDVEAYQRLSEYYDKEQTLNHDDLISKTLLKVKSYVNDHREWCVQYVQNSIIYIHSNSFRVCSLSWGGAEQCPIETYFDSRYHGYQYGCQDYYIINDQTQELLFYGSLLPTQGMKFHFYQSPSSQYRLDPMQFAKFFSMQPDFDYTPQYEEYKTFETCNASFTGSYNPTKENNLQDEYIDKPYNEVLEFEDNEYVKAWKILGHHIFAHSTWPDRKKEIFYVVVNKKLGVKHEHIKSINLFGMKYDMLNTFEDGVFVEATRKKYIGGI